MPSFVLGPESVEALLISSGEEKEFAGLKRCSKIAIIRNIDIKIAVATNPKEIAFIDVPKLFHGASWSTAAWDGLGSDVVYMFQGFDLSVPNSFELMIHYTGLHTNKSLNNLLIPWKKSINDVRNDLEYVRFEYKWKNINIYIHNQCREIIGWNFASLLEHNYITKISQGASFPWSNKCRIRMMF